MPRYELTLILKAMQRAETASTLRRTVENLIERGAVVCQLESLGERTLPYKISKHGIRHARGGYFLVDFYSQSEILPAFLGHLKRDVDVVRPTILRKETGATSPRCCVPEAEKARDTLPRRR